MKGPPKKSRAYFDGLSDGLVQAEHIAKKVTDEFWNTEFSRHGNPGLAKMRQKVRFQIEATLKKAREEAEIELEEA